MAESPVPDVTAVKLADNETILQVLETQSKAKTSNETFETSTYVANLTTKRVFWAEQKVWPGTQGLNGGGEIPTGYYGTVKHRGTLPAGVKFGLVFYDSREELPTTRKFVFAFDLPAAKVYAETGPVGPVDWNVVEDKLDKSGRTTDVKDPILGGRILAGVHENGEPWVEFLDG